MIKWCYNNKDKILCYSFPKVLNFRKASCYVGIGGIGNPAQRLHVKGSAIFENNYGQILLKSTGSGSRWSVQSHAGSGNLNFRWASNDSYFGNVRMTITQAGNVGIGTTNPGARLDVHDGAIRMSVGGNERGIISFDGSNNGVFRLTNNAGTITTFITSGSGDSYINGGNVGIGTNSPQAKLHVAGNTEITGKLIIGQESVTSGSHENFKLAVDGKIVSHQAVVTVDNWGDFVFDEDYQRMSYEEREKFQEKNKHMPYMLSGKLIEKDGMEIGETVKGLTINVEEISLNQIDLYKIIIKMQEQIDQQEKLIEELKRKER